MTQTTRTIEVGSLSFRIGYAKAVLVAFTVTLIRRSSPNFNNGIGEDITGLHPGGGYMSLVSKQKTFESVPRLGLAGWLVQDSDPEDPTSCTVSLQLRD